MRPSRPQPPVARRPPLAARPQPPLPLTPSQRRFRLLVVAGLLAVLALVPTLPLSHPAWPTLPCPSRFLTGLPCPFCGGTRATHALLSGDWQRALYLNPLAFLALAAAAAACLTWLWEAGRGMRVPWPAPGPSAPPWIGASALLALTLFWGFHVWSALTTPKPELLAPWYPVRSEAPPQHPLK